MSGSERKRSRHVSHEVRDAAVAALSASRQQRGLEARVRRVAGELGVRERTVWRWLDAAEARPARALHISFQVTPEDIAELAYRHGNIAALHRARGESPSIWTLRRAIARALTPGELAGLKGGEQARRSFDTYLTRPELQRNECWEGDHCQLAVEVVLHDGQVIKPWLTSFVDRYSRAVCGWAISGHPSRESVLAALRAAILTEAPYGPVGGIPVSLRWDRGKEFLANAVGSAARALGIDAQPLPPYAPHLKGAIERFHETIELLLLDELPGFVHAPERQRRATRGSELLTLHAFITRFADFIVRYNAERPHSSLDGATPLQRWLGDVTPVMEMPRAQLHHLLLAQDTRVVGRRGIRMFGAHYNAAELVGLVGETVEVRFMPHHQESIEVFLRGRHVGTAARVDLMGDEEARQLRRRRVEEQRWLARQQREATRRRNRRFAVITEAVASSTEPEHEERPLMLAPRRSLSDYGPIPDDWVLPLPADQVPDPAPRGSTR